MRNGGNGTQIAGPGTGAASWATAAGERSAAHDWFEPRTLVNDWGPFAQRLTEWFDKRSAPEP